MNTIDIGTHLREKSILNLRKGEEERNRDYIKNNRDW